MTGTPSSPTPDPLADPAQFLTLGRQLAHSRAGGLALALVGRALERHGDDPVWRGLANEVCREEVPSFHARMLRDHRRNAAYRAAIERLAPGRRVLDIGTGSGLLAMMAARAGAARVFACEENAMLAAAARAVIAANGLADRITVFDRHSARLDRHRDLDGGVDLVLSEVFAHTVVGEGVLDSLAHARAELAVPGAVFLPERASVMIALAEFAPPPPPITRVEGFDLTGFGQHLDAPRHILADDPSLILRSAAVCAHHFDFGAGDPPASAASQLDLTSNGGRINGLAQWLHLDLAEGLTYENRPGSGEALHWVVNLVACRERLSAAGDRYAAGSWYSGNTLVNWVEPPRAD